MDCCYDDSNDVVATASSLLHKLAALPKCRATLLANGIMSVLVRAHTHAHAPWRVVHGGDGHWVGIVQSDLLETTPTSMHAEINATLAMVKSDAKPVAAPVVTTKKEPRGVQLNMDGLLGKREHEDEYIRALLMVDGITSVTIDRVSKTYPRVLVVTCVRDCAFTRAHL